MFEADFVFCAKRPVCLNGFGSFLARDLIFTAKFQWARYQLFLSLFVSGSSTATKHFSIVVMHCGSLGIMCVLECAVCSGLYLPQLFLSRESSVADVLVLVLLVHKCWILHYSATSSFTHIYEILIDNTIVPILFVVIYWPPSYFGTGDQCSRPVSSSFERDYPNLISHYTRERELVIKAAAPVGFTRFWFLAASLLFEFKIGQVILYH